MNETWYFLIRGDRITTPIGIITDPTDRNQAINVYYEIRNSYIRGEISGPDSVFLNGKVLRLTRVPVAAAFTNDKPDLEEAA